MLDNEIRTGDVVRLFEGAYGDGTIINVYREGPSDAQPPAPMYADVARPRVIAYSYDGEAHTPATPVLAYELVQRVLVSQLRLAEPRGKYGGPNMRCVPA